MTVAAINSQKAAEEKKLEAAILACLRGERTIREIVQEVRSMGVSESAVKAAVWQLYTLGSVSLTQDWKLRAVRK